jgi:hypothetical protein
MLRKIAWVFAALILFVGTYVAYMMMTTKNHSPEAVEKISVNGLEIDVKYCQPSKKDRLIFGAEDTDALVPYGKKWRTGANEATEISFSEDVQIGDAILQAGRYSLYTIPGPTSWTVVFNSKLGYWGAKLNGDPFEEEFDVLRATAVVTPLDSPVEQFTLSLSAADSVVNLAFSWDQTRATLPIQRIN